MYWKYFLFIIFCGIGPKITCIFFRASVPLIRSNTHAIILCLVKVTTNSQRSDRGFIVSHLFVFLPHTTEVALQLHACQHAVSEPGKRFFSERTNAGTNWTSAHWKFRVALRPTFWHCGWQTAIYCKHFHMSQSHSRSYLMPTNLFGWQMQVKISMVKNALFVSYALTLYRLLNCCRKATEFHP